MGYLLRWHWWGNPNKMRHGQIVKCLFNAAAIIIVFLLEILALHLINRFSKDHLRMNRLPTV